MTVTTRKFGSLILLVLPAALLAVPARAERIDRDYHKTFDVQPGGRLRLEHGDGDVTVTPWDQDVVEIDVRYRAESTGLVSRRGDFEVDFSQHGDTIRVTGREPSFSGIVFSFREHEYTYKIQAPAYLELDFEGEDGDVTIDGWRAKIEASLEDGDLHLTNVEAESFEVELEDGDLTVRNLKGELDVDASDGEVVVQDCSSRKADVRTEDGDIRIERCEGNLTVRSDDGDVHLDQIRAGSVAIETEDGDVGLDLAAATSLDLTIVTQDGTVDVSAPADLSAELDVASGDGRVQIDFPGAEVSKDRHRATGRLGTGEGRVRITTDDGDVTLRNRG